MLYRVVACNCAVAAMKLRNLFKSLIQLNHGREFRRCGRKYFIRWFYNPISQRDFTFPPENSSFPVLRCIRAALFHNHKPWTEVEALNLWSISETLSTCISNPLTYVYDQLYIAARSRSQVSGGRLDVLTLTYPVSMVAIGWLLPLYSILCNPGTNVGLRIAQICHHRLESSVEKARNR